MYICITLLPVFGFKTTPTCSRNHWFLQVDNSLSILQGNILLMMSSYTHIIGFSEAVLLNRQGLYHCLQQWKRFFFFNFSEFFLGMIWRSNYLSSPAFLLPSAVSIHYAQHKSFPVPISFVHFLIMKDKIDFRVIERGSFRNWY